MVVLTIPNIDQAMVERIAHLARGHGRSVEEEAAILLKQALDRAECQQALFETVERIAAMTPKGVKQTDSVELLREDRERCGRGSRAAYMARNKAYLLL